MVHKMKLIMVGDGFSGKTRLQIVFWCGKYKYLDYSPTKMKIHSGLYVNENNESIDLTLWDTSLQFERHRLRCYPNADAILLTFAIDNPRSLQHVKERWLPEIELNRPGVPIVLVGNKKDLRYDSDTIERLARNQMQPISSEDGEAMAAQINAFAYVECSAITREGIKEVFEAATRAVLQIDNKKRKKNAKRQCNCM